MFLLYFLLILSSIFYSFSFIFIEKLWYLIFFFLTPIAYLELSNNISNSLNKKAFKYGFIWGVISFTFQPIGLYISLLNITDQHKIIIIFIIFLLILYQALYSGMWLYISSNIIIKFKNNFIKLLVFSTITSLYFIFLENYILWPFSISKVEGLFLLSPTLPLTIYPSLLYLLHFINKSIFLFIIIFSSSLLAIIFLNKSIIIKILLFFITISPFIFSILIYNNNKIAFDNKIKDLFCNISAITKAFYNPEDNTKSAIKIAAEIENIKKKDKNIKVILFPESAFYLCDLKKELNLIKYFNKKIHIIIGGIRKKKNKFYNTIYHIYNGKIINKFYKRHSLILTERLLFKDFNFFNKIFLNAYFKSRPIITPSLKKRISFNINNNINLIPYICSEIFFNNNPDDDFGKNSIIISLCNDSWICESANYIQKLMILVNKFKAIHWQRYIIYVDYRSAYIFDKLGNQHNIS